MPPIRAARLLTETAHGASICLNRRRSLIRESIHWVACEASHYNCKASRSALFGLRGSLRVAPTRKFASRFDSPEQFSTDGMAQDEDPGTVLVTGAGRRLGRSIALDFATRRWRVGIHYRDSAEEALALAAEIVRNGGIAAAFGADLARLETITPLIEACAEALGTPTCLINNAARFDWDGLCYSRCQDLAGEPRRQSQGSGVPDSGLRQGPAGAGYGHCHQPHRPEGLAARPRAFLLHDCQIRSVDCHANHGAGACPADQGECHCAGARAQEPGPKPGRVRA